MNYAKLLTTAFVGVLASHTIQTASATTINGITLTDQNIFLDDRSINDIGISPGVILQFGGNISGGSSGYSSAGIFTPTGSTTPTIVQTPVPCQPLAVNTNFCNRTTTVSTTQPLPGQPIPATKLNGTWQYQVTSPSNTVATFALPSSTVIPTTTVPFPNSVTITNSANGIQPTISWQLPSGFTADAFRIQIYDRSSILANGTANTIFTTIVSPTATSFTFPATFSNSNGSMQSLTIGNPYTIDFQVIETRDGGPNSNNSQADILTRSNSFFDFTPQLGSTLPGNIALPSVDGATGVYHFNIGAVGPSSITYIDPAVAIGYIYDTGQGDPNFASVTLPDVGGGVFELSFLSTEVTLDAGQQFFFPAGGVSEFEVTGIDPAAGLDPADTSAFVTGLTFVSDGSFTGTMTPITENVAAVPEPGSLVLFATALVGFGAARRRRRQVA